MLQSHVFQRESHKESRHMDAHRMGMPEQFWETVTAPYLHKPCCTLGIIMSQARQIVRMPVRQEQVRNVQQLGLMQSWHSLSALESSWQMFEVQ